jgi:vacuolar-type H+-ATPase subunit I/STV1
MSDLAKQLREFAELEAAQSDYREAERHICWKAADRIEADKARIEELERECFVLRGGNKNQFRTGEL